MATQERVTVTGLDADISLELGEMDQGIAMMETAMDYFRGHGTGQQEEEEADHGDSIQ